MLSKKAKNRKTELGVGLDQAPDPTDEGTPEDTRDDAVLSAIAGLRREVGRIKEDICATIDARIQAIHRSLKEELESTKEEIQKSVAALEKTAAARDATIKDIERAASQHSDDIIALQSQVRTSSGGRHNWDAPCLAV